MSNGFGPAFQLSRYSFRRKVFKLFGGAFHILDESDSPVMYSRQKAFTIREDIMIYTDEDRTQELLSIKTPHIMDWNATYHVTDPMTGEPVGALARQGRKSILKDEWIFLSRDNEEIGKLQEASTGAAILSRILRFIPQKYAITSIDGMEVATVTQRFNPMVLRYDMIIASPDPVIDKRLLVVMGILLCAVEGRQGGNKGY